MASSDLWPVATSCSANELIWFLTLKKETCWRNLFPSLLSVCLVMNKFALLQQMLPLMLLSLGFGLLLTGTLITLCCHDKNLNLDQVKI
jgi:multidrug transporter EmrE-like cation transporter|tara:strand:- start:964 stop:1230 length:267 start_codon:yes stop_codon:yes gene_type:complete